MRFASLLLGIAGLGCSLSPLQNRIKPGEEPFVVVTGTGSDNHTDLFAVLPGGGEVYQLTFTTMTESSPQLTRHGDVVAFLRHGTGSDRARGELVVMNLLNGAERRLDLPDSAGTLRRLGWAEDESHIYLDTDTGQWMVDVPPAAPHARRVAAESTALADTALTLWLGTPRFARVVSCSGAGLCISGPNGEPQELSARGTAPTRWGSDSLGWLEGDEIVVRPLGPGPARRFTLDTKIVTRLTGVSYSTP